MNRPLDFSFAGQFLAGSLALVLATVACPLQADEEVVFAWQQDYARVLPHGGLEWTPTDWNFVAGETIRYIDYENGSDSNSGASRAKPWKHHPWDPNADDLSSAARNEDVDTFIFKGGVVYRGELEPRGAAGEPEKPIRLTRDPSWGKGRPLIYGSERVTGWVRGEHPKIPESDALWQADIDFLPRTLWTVDPKNGRIVRLKLARDPNWEISDRNEILSEWPTWEQPEWWTDRNTVEVDGEPRHLGVDGRLKGFDPADIEGATVWTEWGIVMGSPYPARVEYYDPEQGGVAFRGPWTFDKSERIITGNRYFLEDKPQWLDSDGEFWVEKRDRGGARIYLRLPFGGDPNSVHIEAGARTRFLKTDALYHVDISGLHFRFTNIHWEYDIPQWAHPDLRDAVVRLAGGGDGISIHHNVFEHVVMPLRINASSDAAPYHGSPIGAVHIHDNEIRHTDHEAIVVAGFGDNRQENEGPLREVEILRNRLQNIGHRNLSGAHGHAVDIRFPETSLIAGNFLNRIAGWGIAVFGGKGSGRRYEAPFSRQIITQNRVEDVLLKSNDWGGIETWQGGTHYVFNNLVVNPRGFKNWIYLQDKEERIPAFGHAYYLDGSFKNYLFNNIAWGLNNEPGGKYANNTALQNIISFENTFFHNTFFRFGDVIRQQAPAAGRFRYLSNIVQDASLLLFRVADPKEGEPDPNAAHYSQGGSFAYETLAFSRNVLSDVKGRFGVFEETGAVYDSLGAMRTSLQRLRAQASDIGVQIEEPALSSPENGDFRPRETEAALGMASRVFVPWGLKRVVGEWNFRLNREDPARIIDTHWNMTTGYVDRKNYLDTYRYPLTGVGIDDEDFVAGALEDWTMSALKLDGRNQYLKIEHEVLEEAAADVGSVNTLDARGGDLLIEAVFRCEDANGVLARKWDGTGYALEVGKGKLRFRVADGLGGSVEIESGQRIDDGSLIHVVAELDRGKALSLFINGRRSASRPLEKESIGSLASTSDFQVGGTAEGRRLAATLEFLRVARASLDDARSSAEELHAWQFHGPQFKDFAGRPRDFEKGAAGAIEAY